MPRRKRAAKNPPIPVVPAAAKEATLHRNVLMRPTRAHQNGRVSLRPEAAGGSTSSCTRSAGSQTLLRTSQTRRAARPYTRTGDAVKIVDQNAEAQQPCNPPPPARTLALS